MQRRSNTRYSALRKSRRQTLLATAALLCVCAAAYALAVTISPWTARGDENPAEGKGSVSNTLEVSAVEETGDAGQETTEKRGNETTVKRERPATPPPPPEESCDDARVLVGKKHALPPDYQPTDLASLMAYGVPTYGGDHLLRLEAVEPLSGLVSAAASDGHEIFVLSGFRSYAEQQQNFAHFTGIYGGDAEIVSAPPGQSQHQLGTTVDFTNAEVNYELLPVFGETDASKWLEENAWRHGFIITYPDGDEQGTGRQWEPWEYRYVGEELAEQIHESDMSLRKFLTEEGVRPLC